MSLDQAARLPFVHHRFHGLHLCTIGPLEQGVQHSATEAGKLLAAGAGCSCFTSGAAVSAAALSLPLALALALRLIGLVEAAGFMARGGIGGDCLEERGREKRSFT